MILQIKIILRIHLRVFSEGLKNNYFFLTNSCFRRQISIFTHITDDMRELIGYL